MKLQRSPVPLYHQIARILRSQLRSQEYKLNDRLPTEDELIREYGVSRMTVRLAYHLLLKDGLVRRFPGRGTFVARETQNKTSGEWSVETIDDIISTSYRMESKRKLLGIRELPAPEGLAKAMGVPVKTPVTELKGLRLIKDEPFYHVTLYVPRQLAALIPREHLKERPTIALLEEYCGVLAVKARQWMAASLADMQVARHLKIRPGDPVLLVEIHFTDESGRVIEVSMDRYRTDRVRYYVQLFRSTKTEEGI
jgi:GntR family transcriptional regulator